MRQILVLVLVSVLGFAHSPVAGQSHTSAASPTEAQLRSRIAILERDLAGLQADFDLLVKTCQDAAPRSTAPSHDAAAAERLERASAALAEARAAEENRLTQQRFQQQLENDLWFVKSVDFGVTEANKTFMRFGWNVVLNNGIDRPQSFDVVVYFLDGRGLVVDTARVYGRTIRAFSEETIYGATLIGMPGATSVVRVRAEAVRKSR
jgi:hypothetical protein